MNQEDDHQSATMWPIVLALCFGIVFVGGLIGAFVFGYSSGPNLPVSAPGGAPAWEAQSQTADETQVNEEPRATFTELREAVATDSNELEINIDHNAEQRTIRLTPQSPQK